MLRISKPLFAAQAQTLHAKEFTAAGQNRWKQGDTIPREGAAGSRKDSVLPVPSERKNSHVLQRLTAELVLVIMDTDVHTELINRRFAHLSVSRTSRSSHLHEQRFRPRRKIEP
jgi:hypothetical protein